MCAKNDCYIFVPSDLDLQPLALVDIPQPITNMHGGITRIMEKTVNLSL